jgi:uncharacterized membrane protein YjdF
VSSLGTQRRDLSAARSSAPDPGRRRYVVAGSLATTAFLLISWSASEATAKYRYSFVFLIPILWAVFAIRRALALRPLHFAAFAAALVLHDLGAFGWYQRRVWGLKFDWCVHFVFGVIGFWIIARFLAVRLGLRRAPGAMLTVLVLLGLGGIHEIIEAASTMALGTKHGMLVIGPDNPFDTQQDLLANLLGALVAWGLTRVVPPSRTDTPR